MMYGYNGGNKIQGPLVVGFTGNYQCYNGAAEIEVIGEHNWFERQVVEEGKHFRFEDMDSRKVAIPITPQA